MGFLDAVIEPKVDKLAARGDLEGLVEVLTSQRKAELRTRAAAALASMGDLRAIPALVGALAAQPNEVASAVEDALRAYGPEAAQSLAEALGVDEEAAGERALALLLGIGPPALDALLVAARGGNNLARAHAVPALGTLWSRLEEQGGREAVFRALLAALGDRQSGTRAAAAGYLAAIADPRAAKALAARLKDGDEAVREASHVALERIGGPAVPQLVDALADKNPNSRRHAARLLGEVCPATNKQEDLVAAVETLRQATADRDEVVREAATEALARIPGAADLLRLAEPEVDSTATTAQD